MKTTHDSSIPKRLGDLELHIMKTLWENGASTVSHVQKAFLPTKRLAYTTVATMLRRMEDKGLVTHTEENRSYVYHPAIREESVSKNLAGDLLHKLFDGNLLGLMSHLLSGSDVSSEELDKMELLIRNKRKETRQ